MDAEDGGIVNEANQISFITEQAVDYKISAALANIGAAATGSRCVIEAPQGKRRQEGGILSPWEGQGAPCNTLLLK